MNASKDGSRTTQKVPNRPQSISTRIHNEEEVVGMRKCDNERGPDEDMPVAEESVSSRIFVRPFGSGDSIGELTELLHRAFKKGHENPYTYPAVEQDEDTTREQIESGECLVAVVDKRIVGLCVVWPPKIPDRHSWYHSRRVAHIRQLAVEPCMQQIGIGTILLGACEQIALQMGASELSGSSPVGARQLSLYVRMGYRIVKYVSWSNTSYDSVVFAKYLRELDKPTKLRRTIEKIKYYHSFLIHKLRMFSRGKFVPMF